MATQQQNGATLYNALTSGSKIIGTVITDSDMRVDGVIQIATNRERVISFAGKWKDDMSFHFFCVSTAYH